VYSRVRTLPAILRFAPRVAIKHRDTIRDHLELIWSSVSERPEDQAVREATLRPNAKDDDPLTVKNMSEKLERAYPANAFHTFWALRTLDSCAQIPELADLAEQFAKERDVALLWTQSLLGAQVALYNAGSDRADPSQLAWAVAAQLVEDGRAAKLTTGELTRAPLYEAVLDAFFKQQLPSGKWPLGQPLFHFPTAGNAYCYTFETLAELVRPALYETTAGKLMRELLKPHLDSLLAAWHFVRRSAQPLSAGPPRVGWSSEHHPQRTKPEGWATASVFTFVQRFRRLLGAYTREVAALQLGARPSKYAAQGEGEAKLAERGETWTGGKDWTAGEQLAALFLHPLCAHATRADTIEPDEPLIKKNQARSAILFGPPGTSKTTLVEALAGAIGWDLVEIHASRFLVEGMDKVPATADWIFARLMELDSCVVLFDEIDELLRSRQAKDADPFGRFLTTSMLPKVATLWEQGRIVFFVATNDIAHADPAIKRGQRFDSAIFVAPPSFARKVERLKELLPGFDSTWLSEAEVEAGLTDDRDEGYFALLRFDQIPELVDLLSDGRDGGKEAVRAALGEMGKRLARTDWQPPRSEGAGDAPTPLQMFREMRPNETRDHRMTRLAWLEEKPRKPLPAELEDYEGCTDVGAYVRIVRSGPRPLDSIAGETRTLNADAILRYT
jgi:hypothetical protein